MSGKDKGKTKGAFGFQDFYKNERFKDRGGNGMEKSEPTESIKDKENVPLVCSKDVAWSAWVVAGCFLLAGTLLLVRGCF